MWQTEINGRVRSRRLSLHLLAIFSRQTRMSSTTLLSERSRAVMRTTPTCVWMALKITSPVPSSVTRTSERSRALVVDVCFGTITLDKNVSCPAFFQHGALQKYDNISGGVCLFLSLMLLIVCLIGLVNVLQCGLMGMSTCIIYKMASLRWA